MARSTAEQLRRHREEMVLALQMKCTPREARAVLDQRAARARWEEANRRLQARMNGGGRVIVHVSDDRRRPWYQEGQMA